MIKCGSTFFFPNIKSKDVDYLELVYSDDDFVIREFIGSGIKQDVIQINMNKSKEEIIRYDLKREFGMAIGKYLIPEFADAIGLTIKDLKKLQPLINKLDDKHKYEKVIYESYLINGTFVLNQNQWFRAYDEYINHRH